VAYLEAGLVITAWAVFVVGFVVVRAVCAFLRRMGRRW
jgi:hypothetical protein